MSGNSMAFLPMGSVVYQQYISDTPTTIVSNLKDDGYTCIAMHPYYETGWSRNLVYPHIGFDEMHFIDYFLTQTKILRKIFTIFRMTAVHKNYRKEAGLYSGKLPQGTL